MARTFKTGIIITGDSKDAVRAIKLTRKEIQGIDKTSDKYNRTLNKGTSALHSYRNAIATLGVVAVTRSILDASFAMDGLNTILTQEQFSFVRQEADRLGFSLEIGAKEFAKTAAAAKGTSLEGKGVEEIFKAVTTASVALNLSQDDLHGILRAVQQMMSKGNIQAEELRGQLGERLPGAVQLTARALGITTQELNKMLEKGEVLAEDTLPKLAKLLQEEYGDKAVEMSKKGRAALNRFNNAWFELRDNIATAGVGDAFLTVATVGTDALKGVSENLGIVGLAVATLAGVLTGKFVGAMTASTASILANIKTDQAKYVQTVKNKTALVASTQASRVHAQILLAEAEASVAAASGMSRLTVVTNTLIPAQQRLATATAAVTAAQTVTISKVGVLSKAMTFLGGPVGVVITAAIAISAFASLLDTTAESADKLATKVGELGVAFNQYTLAVQKDSLVEVKNELVELGEKIKFTQELLSKAPKFSPAYKQFQKDLSELHVAEDKLKTAHLQLVEVINKGEATLQGSYHFDGMTKSAEEATGALEDHKEALDKILKGIREEGELARSTARHKAGYRAVQAALKLGYKGETDAIYEAAAAQHDLTEANKEATAKKKKLATEQKRLREELEKTEYEKLRYQVEELAIEERKLKEETEKLEQATKDFNKENENRIRILNAYIEGGERAVRIEEELIRAEEAKIEVTRESIEANVDIIESIEDRIEAEKETEQAVRNLADTFADVIVEGRSFSDTLEEIFKDAAARILASGIYEAIEGIFGVGDKEFNGGDIFGNASNGNPFLDIYRNNGTSSSPGVNRVNGGLGLVNAYNTADQAGNSDSTSGQAIGYTVAGLQAYDAINRLRPAPTTTPTPAVTTPYTATPGTITSAPNGYSYNANLPSGVNGGFGSAGPGSAGAFSAGSTAAPTANFGTYSSLDSVAGSRGVGAGGSGGGAMAGAGTSLFIVTMMKALGDWSEGNQAKRREQAMRDFSTGTFINSNVGGANFREGVGENAGQGFVTGGFAATLIAQAAGASLSGKDDDVQTVDGKYWQQLSGDIAGAQNALSNFTPEIEAHYRQEFDAKRESISQTKSQERQQLILQDVQRAQSVEFVASLDLAQNHTDVVTQAIAGYYQLPQSAVELLRVQIADGLFTASEAAAHGIKQDGDIMVSSFGETGSAAQVLAKLIKDGTISAGQAAAAGIQVNAQGMVTSFGSAGTAAEALAELIEKDIVTAAEAATAGVQSGADSMGAAFNNARNDAINLANAVYAIPSGPFGGGGRGEGGDVQILRPPVRGPGGNTGNGGGVAGGGSGAGGGLGRHFGTGGRFEQVPAGYPNDSFLVRMESGEDFMVRTAADRANGVGENRRGTNQSFFGANNSSQSSEVRQLLQRIEYAVNRGTSINIEVGEKQVKAVKDGDAAAEIRAQNAETTARLEALQ